MVCVLAPFSKMASSGLWWRIQSSRTAGYWSTPPLDLRNRFTCGSELSFHAGQLVTTPHFEGAPAPGQAETATNEAASAKRVRCIAHLWTANGARGEFSCATRAGRAEARSAKMRTTWSGGEAGGKGACRDRHVCTCALRSNTTHRSATTHPKPTRGRRGQCRGGGDREEYTSDYM